MAYRTGRFVWFELITPNVDDGVAFWTEATGLGVTEMAMGEMTYKMFTREGKTQAGAAPPQMAGVPPHWLSYVSVDDVDGKHAAVAKHGGSSIVPPMDIPNIGRFAIVADPEGAVFALFRGTDGDEGGATAFAWNELWCRDPKTVLAFYAKVFGYGQAEMPMPTGTYHLLKVGEESVAGVMASPDPKVPPMWLPYLAVDDADAVAARVRAQKGAVHAEPMSMEGVGRFAIVADRQGATLGVLKPAPR